MNDNSIINNDIEYYLSQKQSEIDLVVAGMTALMSDSNSKYEAMKNQNWFKRMILTVTGKNKATIADIRKNNEQLSAYCAKVLASFVERQRISESIILNLGVQINTLYASHIELKQILHGIATKLNEKIESVDNYHLLFEEITLGRFSEFYADIYRILALIDKRMIFDARKMRNIAELIEKNNIISDNTINVAEYLLNVCDIHSDYVGVVYMEALAHHDNITSQMTVAVIENWNFVHEANRQFLKKQNIVNKILTDFKIESSIKFSIATTYKQAIENKKVILNSTILADDYQIVEPFYIENKETQKANEESALLNIEALSDNKIFTMGLELLFKGGKIISPRPNMEIDTLGGNILWYNLAEYKGWRVQENSIFGNCRVLDDGNIRRSWGDKDELLRAFKRMITENSQTVDKG